MCPPSDSGEGSSLAMAEAAADGHASAAVADRPFSCSPTRGRPDRALCPVLVAGETLRGRSGAARSSMTSPIVGALQRGA